jgi:hypothetical protein
MGQEVPREQRRVGESLADIPALKRLQRIPDSGKPKAGEVPDVGCCQFCDSVVSQSECQAHIKDAPPSEMRGTGVFPDLLHDATRIIQELPVGMVAEALDDRYRGSGCERMLEEHFVAKQSVEFDQTQLTKRYLGIGRLLLNP